MDRQVNWPLVVIGGIITGLVVLGLLVGAVFLLRPSLSVPVSVSTPAPRSIPSAERFESNGEMIYFTGVNEQGERIPFTDGPMWLYRHGGGCADCHGADGRGGRVQMMMEVFEVPDIRYETLTSEAHGEGEEHEEEEMEHAPFTEETIKQAITEGIEPDGEALDWPMPRWSMSEQDLDDLVEFLKTLD